MIGFQPPLLPAQSLSPELQGIEKFFRTTFVVATLIGRAMVALHQQFVSAAEQADREHRRAELLAAYRQRHSWKKGDIPRLQSLGVNGVAQKRMERLTGRGRPVVRLHQPLGSNLYQKIQAINALYDPTSPPNLRRKAFRSNPWWPHYVEALYRGEHVLAKQAGILGAAGHAEELVGRALGVSAAAVHAVCGEIRRKRREWDGAANFRVMTLAEYSNWMETGTKPRAEDE